MFFFSFLALFFLVSKSADPAAGESVSSTSSSSSAAASAAYSSEEFSSASISTCLAVALIRFFTDLSSAESPSAILVISETVPWAYPAVSFFSTSGASAASSTSSSTVLVRFFVDFLTGLVSSSSSSSSVVLAILLLQIHYFAIPGVGSLPIALLLHVVFPITVFLMRCLPDKISDQVSLFLP